MKSVLIINQRGTLLKVNESDILHYLSSADLLKSFSEAVTRRSFVKKVFLKISQNTQKTPVSESFFLIRLQAQACNFIKKETQAQVFSCEFCEIFKNSLFYRTPPVAASNFSQLILSIFLFPQHFSQCILPGGKKFSQLIVSIFIFSQYFFQ